jgi:arabinose-5-phosphate isomerase
MPEKPSDDLVFAREVIESEVRALQALAQRLGGEFRRAVELLLGCTGRVVVTGIGKAGLIGQKISATLASTGTPSYSLHPVEAIHGDLGRIVEGDVVLALSNSGETEVVQVLKAVKRMGARVIAVTGDPKSTLGRQADVVLDIGQIQEACPLGLAPSASTTAMLALGDALALAVAKRRNFDKERFALYHPGGELGRKLMRVEEVMRGLDQCAVVLANLSVSEALEQVNRVPGRPGAACITDESGRLVGIFTDGDLRRRVARDTAFLAAPISAVMTRSPKSIRRDSLALEAAAILEKHKIDELPVVDSDGRLCGILDVQDLLAVGLMPLDTEP